MNHIIRHSLLLMFFTGIVTGCIEEIDLNEINGPTSGRLVIEGGITNETKQHSILLSRTKVAVTNTPAERVSGAAVAITDGINRFVLEEIDTIPGIYLTGPNVAGEIGRTYVLTVMVDDITYTAEDTMEPVTPFGSVEELFELPNRVEDYLEEGQGVYEHQFPKVRYGVAAPSKQTLFSYDSIANGLRQAVFYEFPQIDRQGFLLNFAGTNPTLILEVGSTVVQFKSSMSRAHYDFIRAVFAETQFRGGIFDNIPGNAPTNVSNGGLGFFSASAVITRTFTVTGDNLDQ